MRTQDEAEILALREKIEAKVDEVHAGVRECNAIVDRILEKLAVIHAEMDARHARYLAGLRERADDFRPRF